MWGGSVRAEVYGVAHVQVRAVGFSLCTAHQQDKAPGSNGVRINACDALAVIRDRALPMIGNMLVELAVAMGVVDPGHLARLQDGDAVVFKPGTEEWCALVAVLWRCQEQQHRISSRCLGAGSCCVSSMTCCSCPT